METIYFILFLSFLKLCVTLDHVWHSYQYNPIHQSREELVIANITADDQIKFENLVTKWKSLRVEELCYVVGLMERNVTVASIKLDQGKSGFVDSSHVIELNEKPIDVALFKNWNTTRQDYEAIVVIATTPKLLWYRIGETNSSLFWSWPIEKTISHLNIFQIDYNYHLLIINQYLTQTTADLYQFELKERPNFWLNQKIELVDLAPTSAVTTFGPDYFIAIPQTSIDTLIIYKLSNNHFVPFSNLTSQGINDVIAFNVGHKSFLAIDGLDAGIFRINKRGLSRESVAESHLNGVNYWLPIHLSVYGDAVLLIAQRSLYHGGHKSFVIEVITYNGDKFEEHEDILCFYFGEEILGLSCLPDEAGIEGSAVINLGGTIGLLVPRKNRFSDLFWVETKIVKIPSPLDKQIEEFLQKKEYINNLIELQEKRYNEIVANSRQGWNLDLVKTQLDEMLENVNSLKEKLSSAKSSKTYESIIFNGVVTIENGIFDEVETEQINGEPSDVVLGDIVLKNRLDEISSSKIFTDLTVEDLIVEKVNNINTTNLLFTTDNITIDGDLLLEQPLNVLGNVNVSEINGFNFENEVIDLNQPIAEPLSFENVKILGKALSEELNDHYFAPTAQMKTDLPEYKFETLSLPFNIEVDKVNGEDFNQFLRQLCLTNIENYVPGTVNVIGQVTVEGDAEVDFLNSLKFPQEYVFSDDTFPNITGRKIFDSLETSEVNCEGTIDGVQTSEIITLSTDQNVTGTTTFKHLKITESLNVDGEIIGEHASKFLPNPTLLETDFVTARVNFKDLEVEGSIIISENFNGKNFDALLSDIVYTNEEEPVITGVKQFPEGFTVRKNLVVESDSINSIPLNSIVTKNSDQVLNVSFIDGTLSFANVEVEGLYNGVDVKKLDEELVKLDGEQYISSTLIFQDTLAVEDLDFETITPIRSNHFFNGMADTVVEVENIVVEGNVYATIKGFDLERFDKSRMSLTKNQSIDDMTIENSFITNINPGKINNRDYNEYTPEAIQAKLKEKFLDGSLEVKDLYVKDSIEIGKINNKSAINLGGNLFENGFQKHNITNLTFYGNVTFDDVEIEKLSGVDFQYFVSNLIFKNETDVKISGTKTFLKGFTVKKLIETERLNNVSLSNILTKYGEQEVLGPLTIEGDVIFEDNVTISENINDLPINLITDAFQTHGDNYQINGDVLFHRLPYIGNLQIEGSVNGRPAQEIIDGIVYKDGDFKLYGPTVFKNNVNVEKNINVIGKINNIDLPALVSDMVMITQDATIVSSVRFTEPTFVENEIVIDGNLKTEGLNNIDLQAWMDNAVFVDRGYLRGKFLFEDVEIVDNLNIEYLNNINMSTLIPLRTQQDLDELSFTEISIFKDVFVGNSTNFLDLPSEFANSALINSDQVIESDVRFQGNVFIENDVELSGFLNDMDTDRIVTTNTDQELTAVYVFKSKTNFEKNLTVEGLVNGINMTFWASEGVQTSAPFVQNITDSWVVDQDLVFEEDVEGTALINGVDFKKFGREIGEKRNYKYMVEKGFIDDYINICKDLTYMYDKLKKQIYKFDYLEKLQTLNFHNKIEQVFNYEYQNKTYLLINEHKNCESYLFKFDEHFNYVKSPHFGLVAQIISVRYNDLKYLVVRNQPFYSTCKVQGTNLWQLIDNDFVHVANIEDQDLLQESLALGTFYGIKGHEITEFKIVPELDIAVHKYRTWEVKEDNMAFVPRGLATGLALRTGRKLIKLDRDDPIIEDLSYDTQSIIKANCTEEFNTYFPGRKGSDLVVTRVGIKSSKRNLLAVASYEETSVRGSLDFIKIYEDVFSGKVFQKIATYNPSDLVSLEFSNGETLLAFMEDESILQVYEYKGIEGFKHKLSSKIKGSHLFEIKVPDGSKKERKVLGVVDKNKINFIEALMLGTKVEENLRCEL